MLDLFQIMQRYSFILKTNETTTMSPHVANLLFVCFCWNIGAMAP